MEYVFFFSETRIFCVLKSIVFLLVNNSFWQAYLPEEGDHNLDPFFLYMQVYYLKNLRMDWLRFTLLQVYSMLNKALEMALQLM